MGAFHPIPQYWRRSAQDGWSEAIPINWRVDSDGFREGLTPSYGLESIDRFAFDSGPDQRLEAFAIGDIDACGKHVFEEMNDADILKQADARLRRDLDDDIDLRAIVAAGDGTEKRGMGNPLRPQLGLTIPQLPYDLIALHGIMIT